MARPRIFVSSTYYDLKHIRSDLERFISTQGYDPILNEKGHISYGNTEKLEEYCYKEIEHCDVLVSIIGGRYGSKSTLEHSVSNRELLEAIKLGKQVYIFIDSTVANEFRTYQANKDVEGIKYQAVDDTKVYQFLETVYDLRINNTICNFSSSKDISNYLKEQWAGLFQRLLNEDTKKKEVDLIQKLSETSSTLNKLVEYLVSDKKEAGNSVEQILKVNHPIFNEIKRFADIPFRVFFETFGELNTILEQMNLKMVGIQETYEYKDGYTSWMYPNTSDVLRISNDLFKCNSEQPQNNDKLITMINGEWDKEYVIKEDSIPF